MRFILALGLIGLAAAPAFAQNIDSLRPGHRPLLPRDREIALARSAAPPMVSDSATIWVLGDTAYQVAVRGTNGNVCWVSRSWLDTIEPECFDAEGAATVLQQERLHVEMLHRGRTEAQAQLAIADALREGRLRPPSRLALCYMLSPDQWLINDKREVEGHWHAHLMMYYPYLTGADLGLGDGIKGTAGVLWEGTPWSALVVILPQFTHPVATAGAPPR
jgi:hypothetical protein